MAHKLEVVTDFMYSGYLPEICIFSGRTDNLEKSSLNLARSNKEPLLLSPLFPFMVISFVIFGLLPGLMFMAKTQEQALIPVYENPNGRFRWKLTRYGGGIMLILAVLLPIFAIILLPAPAPKFAMGLLFTLSGVLAVGGIGWLIWGALNTFSLRTVTEHTVQLRFPNHLKSVHEKFASTYAEFLIPYEEGRRIAKTARNSKLKYTQSSSTAATAETPVAEDSEAEFEAEGVEKGTEEAVTANGDGNSAEAPEEADIPGDEDNLEPPPPPSETPSH